MIGYCVDLVCRHLQISRYFGGGAEKCKTFCDVCVDLSGVNKRMLDGMRYDNLIDFDVIGTEMMRILKVNKMISIRNQLNKKWCNVNS